MLRVVTSNAADGPNCVTIPHPHVTGANEISAGLGFYLREHCSMVIGWPRGGGSRIVVRVPFERFVVT